MAKAFGATIKKLQSAINNKFEERILISRQQFYSVEASRPIEMIVVKRAVWDEHDGKMKNIEMFSSTSDLQVVLFLRDYWYELNGWEVPTDNQKWNEAKHRYIDKHLK